MQTFLSGHSTWSVADRWPFWMWPSQSHVQTDISHGQSQGGGHFDGPLMEHVITSMCMSRHELKSLLSFVER